MGYPAASSKLAEQQQQQPPAYGLPVIGAAAAMQSVPLTLVNQGGRFLFPDAYSLQLDGRMTREEFSAIVAELNDTALEYGPSMGGWRDVLAVLPCTGPCTLLTWKAQLDNLKCELQRTCVAINARNGRSTGDNRLVNLLYREVPSGTVYGDVGGGGCNNVGGFNNNYRVNNGTNLYRFGEMTVQVEVQVLG